MKSYGFSIIKYVNLLHNFQPHADLFTLISVFVIKRSLVLTAENTEKKENQH